MKTNYFTKRIFSVYSLLGLIGVFAASCGSYQESSYYDRDGIYGSAQREQATTQEAPKTNQYKEYFSSLQKEPIETFTNVDNYNSYYADSADTARPEYSSGYAGWGGDSDNVTVNVYGNNWGYNYWNNYWYGPYWGWGWNSWYGPSWGISWGWGSWYGLGGWGYPYYGYYGWDNWYYPHGWHGNHYYSNGYRGGQRGGYYSNGSQNNSIRHYNQGRRSYTQLNGNNPRSYSTPGTRTFTRSNDTRSSSQGNNTYTPPRNNNNNNTRATPASTRSYPQPTYNSGGGGRSSSGGYNSGSSSSGGNRGGGRR